MKGWSTEEMKEKGKENIEAEVLDKYKIEDRKKRGAF